MASPRANEIIDGYRFRGGDPSLETSWEKIDLPKSGDVMDGYTFKGGDPALESAWEPYKEKGVISRSLEAIGGAFSNAGLDRAAPMSPYYEKEVEKPKPAMTGVMADQFARTSSRINSTPDDLALKMASEQFQSKGPMRGGPTVERATVMEADRRASEIKAAEKRASAIDQIPVADLSSSRPSDYMKQLYASGIDAYGFMAQAGGTILAEMGKGYAQEAMRAGGRDEEAERVTGIQSVNPLKGLSDVVRDSMSGMGKEYAADSMKGALFSPSTWQLPETTQGLAMTFSQGLGSMATLLLPGAIAAKGLKGATAAGAISGGATTAGGAISEIRENFSKLTPQQWEQIPAYQNELAKGLDPSSAKINVENNSANIGGALAAIAGAAGGYFNAKVLEDIIAKKGLYLALGKISESAPVRTLAGGAIGAVAEGGQEVGETVGKNIGENIGRGESPFKNADRDTFGAFVGGAMIGGPTGAGAGFVSRANQPELKPSTPPAPITPAQPQPPAPVAPTPQTLEEITKEVRSATTTDDAIAAANAIIDAPMDALAAAFKTEPLNDLELVSNQLSTIDNEAKGVDNGAGPIPQSLISRGIAGDIAPVDNARNIDVTRLEAAPVANVETGQLSQEAAPSTEANLTAWKAEDEARLKATLYQANELARLAQDDPTLLDAASAAVDAAEDLRSQKDRLIDPSTTSTNAASEAIIPQAPQLAVSLKPDDAPTVLPTALPEAGKAGKGGETVALPDRVTLGSFGKTPKAASPIELVRNEQGGYGLYQSGQPALDYETANPITYAKGMNAQQILVDVKSRAKDLFGTGGKFYQAKNVGVDNGFQNKTNGESVSQPVRDDAGIPKPDSPAEVSTVAPETQFKDLADAKGKIKTFANEKSANLYLKNNKKTLRGYKSRKDGSDWVLSKVEKPRSAKQKTNDLKLKKRSPVDSLRDDLLRAIGKMGGISKEEALANGFDEKDIVAINRKYPGKQPFRVKNGKTFDGMLEAINEDENLLGYLDFDQKYDLAHLIERVSDSVKDTATYRTFAGQEYMQELSQAAQEAAEAKAQADVTVEDIEDADVYGLTREEQEQVLDAVDAFDDADLTMLYGNDVTEELRAAEDKLQEQENEPDSEREPGTSQAAAQADTRSPVEDVSTSEASRAETDANNSDAPQRNESQTEREEVAPEPITPESGNSSETRADTSDSITKAEPVIPPVYAQRTTVKARVLDEDSQQFTQEEVSAQEAIRAYEEDIETLERVKLCVGGG